jgi:predicted nuclease with RNAse H fold
VKTYLGIDLTSRAERPSAYAVLGTGARLVEVGSVGTDDEILRLALARRPRFVAVDAPVGLPRGHCCLEESCPCRAVAADGKRASEREVSRRGIGLFFTTKRSIIKAMVYRAIELRRRLEREGLHVLEVFPYASKVFLFGRPLPKKTTSDGLAYLRLRLEDLVPGLATYRGALTHDGIDAVLAAHTAYLRDAGRAEEVGDPIEGAICLPRRGGPAAEAC